jgi:serine/threonine protein kinase
MARGGMSTLFKARDLQRDHERSSSGCPLPIYSSGIGSWSIFRREKEIGHRLDHPFVLKFLKLDADNRRSYLVTEYVPGRTLANRRARCAPPWHHRNEAARRLSACR